MEIIKTGDFVKFKSNSLNVLTGNTPILVKKSDSKIAFISIFLGPEFIHLDCEVDCKEPILFKYGSN
jgi:hypothetical protein